MTGTAKELWLPVVPNRPLVAPEESPRLGQIALRRNVKLGLVENQCFDSSLVDYDDQYQNDQSQSAVFRAHLGEVMEILKTFTPRRSRLVEVGCGKGQFIEMLDRDGYFDAFGYDEAYQGSRPGIQRRYLSSNDRIDCEIVVLRHVLEHVQNPYRFLKLVAEVFGDIPVYCEVPDFDWSLETEAFFDVTYDHVNYFNQRSLKLLFGGNVLKSGYLFGRQYLFVVARLGDLSANFEESFLAEENWEELHFGQLFPSFQAKCDELEAQLDIHRIFVWGAATKGCLFTFHLTRLGRLRERLEFAVDINSAKWSKYIPGTSVQIRSPQDLYGSIQEADVVVVTNPNYEGEIRTLLANRGLEKVLVWTL